MIKRIAAYTVSVLFLPFLMPVFLSAYVVFSNPYIYPEKEANLQVLRIVVLLTAIFPLFTVLLLYLLKFVKSVELRSRDERIIPYVASGAYYIWAYYVFYREGFNNTIAFILLGSCICIFLALIVNVTFFKVSMHTTAAGGLVAATMLLIPVTYSNAVLWFFVAVLIAGAIGSARLILKAHTEREVYYGYLLGFFSFMIAYNFF